MLLVVAAEGVEEVALHFAGDALLGLEVEDGGAGGAEDGALVDGGHVAAGPIFCAGDGAAGGIEHDDEAWEVLVDAAQAVVDP